MKFFTTPAQRRILQYFWADNKPFTLDDLLENEVLRFRLYGKILLSFMQALGQVLPCDVVDGQRQYIGTTDSKKEWDSILKNKKFFGHFASTGGATAGLNRYEIQVFHEFKKRIILNCDKIILEGDKEEGNL